MNKPKPCPFCGGELEIRICDEEGNLRSEDYLDDPWSGLGFQLFHSVEKNPGCPIANYECGKNCLGIYVYDTQGEAIDIWNTRKDSL